MVSEVVRNEERIIKERKAEKVRAEAEKENKNGKNKSKGKTGKEEDILYSVCVKNGSRVEVMVIDCPKTRILELEPLSSHLSLLLMNEDHEKIFFKFPEEIGELEKNESENEGKMRYSRGLNGGAITFQENINC